MGTLTLDEMKTEIRAGLGDRSDYDDRLTLLINLAQMRLARRHDFEELKAQRSLSAAKTGTIGDDLTVALPTTTRQIYSIAVIDGANSAKLIGRPGREWDKEIPYAEDFARGRPSQYRRIGDDLEIWKIPDETYTLRMYSSNWPTDLSASGDKSDLDQKDDLIILLTLIWLTSLQDRSDRANFFWAVFKSVYEEAVGEEQYRPDNVAGKRFGDPATNYWSDPFRKTSP